MMTAASSAASMPAGACVHMYSCTQHMHSQPLYTWNLSQPLFETALKSFMRSTAELCAHGSTRTCTSTLHMRAPYVAQQLRSRLSSTTLHVHMHIYTTHESPIRSTAAAAFTAQLDDTACAPAHLHYVRALAPSFSVAVAPPSLNDRLIADQQHPCGRYACVVCSLHDRDVLVT